jgi:hypothetical protein
MSAADSELEKNFYESLLKSIETMNKVIAQHKGDMANIFEALEKHSEFGDIRDLPGEDYTSFLAEMQTNRVGGPNEKAIVDKFSKKPAMFRAIMVKMLEFLTLMSDAQEMEDEKREQEAWRLALLPYEK